MNKRITLIIVLIIKLICFYLIVGSLSFFTPAITILGVVLFLTSILSTGKGIITTMIFDILLSIIFIIDLNYFNYYGVLSTVNQIDNIKYLAGVQNSFWAEMNWFYLLFFINIPLYFRRSKFSNTFNKNVFSSSLISFIIFCCITFLFQTNGTSNVKNLIGDEFFTYHIKDYIENQATEEIKYITPKNTSAFKPIPNKYFGIAKGYNLITIQLEAVQDFVINAKYNGVEITPNMNKLVAENSFYFDKYYQLTCIGNTADAEFASLTSMYPDINSVSFIKYDSKDFYALPEILQDSGYHTVSVHGNTPKFWNRENMYKTLGFDRFLSKKDFKEQDLTEDLQGISDRVVFTESVDYLIQQKQPFFSFMITLSSHHPYKIGPQNTDLKLEPELQNTLLGNYLNAVRYTDACLGLFIELLKDRGLYDKTMFAIYGDHVGVKECVTNAELKLMQTFIKGDYNVSEKYNIPLIIHLPNSEIFQTNSVIGSQLDFMPTILNLLGINVEYPKSVFGQNLLTPVRNYAPLISFIGEGSFISDDYIVEVSKTISTVKHVYKPLSGENIKYSSLRNRTTVDKIGTEICAEINNSNYLIENNLMTDNKHHEIKDSFEGKTSKRYVLTNGGPFGRFNQTNSVEAVEKTISNGFKHITLNTFLTSDSKCVFASKQYRLDKNMISHTQFMAQLLHLGTHPIDLSILSDFIAQDTSLHVMLHTIYVDDKLELFKTIAMECKNNINRIIPIVSEIDDYYIARELGFSNISFNSYYYIKNHPDEMDELNDFLVENNIFSVIVPANFIGSSFFNHLKRNDVYIHTEVTNDVEAQKFSDLGVDGFLMNYHSKGVSRSLP